MVGQQQGFPGGSESKQSACNAGDSGSIPACQMLQSCLTLHDPMDCSQPGSSVHGIFQARILEWDAMPSPWGSSQPRGWTMSLASLASPWAGGFSTTSTTWEAPRLGTPPGGGNGNPLQYLAWRIPWTEEPGGLQSTGLPRVGHDWATNTFTFSNSVLFFPFGWSQPGQVRSG